MLYSIKQVPVEKFKLRFPEIKSGIKIFVCFLLFLAAGNVNAQSPEDGPIQPEATEPATLPVSQPGLVPGASDEKPAAEKPPEAIVEEPIEWFAEEEEAPRIYRKDNVENPCDRGLDKYGYEKQWYDDTQIYINSKFCEPALWFDNFFANDRLIQEGVAGTYIRWRNDFTYDEEANFAYKTQLNASVEMPGFDKRLHLTFEGDQDEALRDVSPGGARANATNSTLGLQLNLRENDRSKFTGNISLSPKLLLRYRYTYPVNTKVTMRLTQELERKKATNKARTLIEYEHTLKKSLLFRSSSEGRVSEAFEGVDWLQAFVVYQRLSKRASLAYETSMTGITQPRSLTTNYRVGVRFRKNFHREWLFYEIAPEVTWPITLEVDREDIKIGRRSKYLIFFRLEVHFGNARKKRYESYY